MARSPTRYSGLDKPGIRLIAAELGISPSTVSRALRPETAHLVNEARRKQVLDLAEQMRFTPNPGARMLRRGVNSTLTVVVPLDETLFYSEFYSRFLGGVLHSAAERSWDVQIRTLKRTKDTDIREAMQLIGMDTSGVIYLGEPLSAEDLEQLATYRRPLVLTKASMPCDFDVTKTDLPIVGVNNQGGARSAVNLLQQLGHRSIGLLLGPSSSRDAHERRKGYLEGFADAGIKTRSDWIIEVPFNFDGGRAGMQKLLNNGKLPTALCCASDEIAFGAITTLQTAGLQCPDDLSVVGFDDGIWATRTHPALTTVRQPLSDMTERAVGFIIEEATTTTKRKVPQSAEMPAPLVLRQSTRSV
jgi:DNA-binding LacI/PurR family transcriptional regulator